MTLSSHSNAEDGSSVVCFSIGEDRFVLFTSQVLEVLGRQDIRLVPHTPPYILGIISYRGDVLTTLSFRALLGAASSSRPGTLLVLQDEKASEPWCLRVDAAHGVLSLSTIDWEPNPDTLDERSQHLFDGFYRLHAGSIVRLDAHRLQPDRLASMDIFHGAEREDKS